MCRLTRLWDDSRSTGSLGDEGGAAGLVAEEPNQGSSSTVPIVCVRPRGSCLNLGALSPLRASDTLLASSKLL